MNIFSFLLDQKRNKKIKSALPRRSNSFLNAKRKKLAALKQIFFLRILQTFDARLRQLRTFELVVNSHFVWNSSTYLQ
jgi:hypothetical protein